MSMSAGEVVTEINEWMNFRRMAGRERARQQMGDITIGAMRIAFIEIACGPLMADACLGL